MSTESAEYTKSASAEYTKPVDSYNYYNYSTYLQFFQWNNIFLGQTLLFLI